MLLGSRRCISVVGAACAVVFGCLCSTPAAVGLPACEAKYATIEDVRLIALGVAGASFEAEINPEGTETSYEFVILGRQLHFSEAPERLPAPVQGGRLAASTSVVAVNVLLSGLQSGYIYWLEVVATNLAGKTRSTPGAIFYDDPSAEHEPTSDPWPYRTDESGCAIESGDLAAVETVREQRGKEAVEAKAAEAKAAEEAARERQGEEQERSLSRAQPDCVVPGLKGDTLRLARRRIAAAHCSLGGVKRPRVHHGVLVVAQQTPPRGKRLKDGAPITLTLRSR
jgi:hypothetical protein